jgi:hypothetical protein
MVSDFAKLQRRNEIKLTKFKIGQPIWRLISRLCSAEEKRNNAESILLVYSSEQGTFRLKKANECCF